ncbi:MAG: NUDIX domain-containing protein [Verrucomicrobiota bacterium]
MDHPFRHCSDCGATDLTPRSEREFVCQKCGFRHFVTPIPAACAILLDSQGRLLVIRRAHEPGLGKLGLPGGVIEGAETAEHACAREVNEEVGLTVTSESFSYVASLPNRYLFQGFVWPTIDLFYLARLESFDGVLPAESEVSEWMALPLDQVPLEDFAFRSNAQAVRIIRQRLKN